MITCPERPTLALHAQRLRLEFVGPPPEPPRPAAEPKREAVTTMVEYRPREAA